MQDKKKIAFFLTFFIFNSFAILFLYETFLTSKIWISPNYQEYLLRYPADHWTRSLVKLKDSKKNDIAVLGGSICIQAFDSDEVLTELFNSISQSIKVNSYCTTWRSVSDEIKIVNDLNSTKDFIFIVDEGRFKLEPITKEFVRDKNDIYNTKLYSLLLDKSDIAFLNSLNIKVPWFEYLLTPRTSHYFGELLRAHFTSIVKRGKLQKSSYIRINHAHHAKTAFHDNRKKEVMERFQKEGLKWDEKTTASFNNSIQLFEHLFKKIKSRGGRVFLLIFPTNPTFDKIFGEFGRTKKVLEFAKNWKSAGLINYYADIRTLTSWKDSDFRDHHHFLKPGREKIKKIFREFILSDLKREIK